MYLKRIADLREDNDLKQKDIAEFLKVNRSTYSKWESGDNNIPLLKLDILAVKYNVSFDYIFGITKNKRIENAIYSSLDMDMFCHNIRLMRKRAELTQATVARKLGVSKSTYSRYESGSLIIPIDKFSALFNIFDISLDVLAGKVKLPRKTVKEEFIKVSH